jgi:hypothetical protein
MIAVVPSLTPPTEPRPAHTPEGRSPLSWWGDRGVRTKTLTAVGAAAVVAVGVGMLGISALGDSAATSEDLYESNITALEASADMKDALGKVRIAARNALLTPLDADSVTITRTTIPELAAEFHAAADAYTGSSPTPEKQNLVDEAVVAFDDYVEATRTVLGPLALKLDYAGWWATNDAEVAPLAVTADDNIAEVRAMEHADASADAAAARDQYTSQRTTAIAVLLVGLGVALLVGFLVARASPAVSAGCRRSPRRSPREI